MICLCLAIASVGRAMQRQSDNRHHLVVQVCDVYLCYALAYLNIFYNPPPPLGHGFSLEISKSAWRKCSRD